jgi:hypothetical protein
VRQIVAKHRFGANTEIPLDYSFEGNGLSGLGPDLGIPQALITRIVTDAARE